MKSKEEEVYISRGKEKRREAQEDGRGRDDRNKFNF